MHDALPWRITLYLILLGSEAAERERKMEEIAGSSKPNGDDAYAFLNIVKNPDGSLTRADTFPLSPPQFHLPQQQQPIVLSKDVPLNPSHKTWLRIYRPNNILSPTNPLPILIYCHGGGFILHSAATAPIHVTCEQLSSHVPAIVVSLEHRLAPEHRLPAAYDDAIEAVRWVRDQAPLDSWLQTPHLVDFSRCFLMGTSSGGNIVYHAGLRSLDLDPPFKISGLILDQPFFGGLERTESELRLARDKVLPLHATDLLWELSLPVGTDRNHEFCNPIRSGPHQEKVGAMPTCLLRGYDGDPLVDRQRAVASLLERSGVHVVGRFREDGCHGLEYFYPEKAQILWMDIKDFIFSAGNEK